MEGTENIEDETILKRHQKPETDEKRRKRLKIRAFIISRLLILILKQIFNKITVKLKSQLIWKLFKSNPFK